MDPEDLADKYVRKADALAAAKRTEEALGVYDLAVGVYPDCTEAWTGKANVLRLQGKRREALECAERALEIGLSPVAETLRDILVDELRREGAIR
jgi:tetratricopeptide (TPR) repeat protein